MNLLLAVLALTGALSDGADVPIWTKQPPVIGRLDEGSPAMRAGLHVGDRIVSVNGRPVATWELLDLEVVPKANRELDFIIDRGGERIERVITPEAVTKYEFGNLGIGPRHRPELTQVVPDSAASRAGLQPGDVLVAVGGERDLSNDQVVERIPRRRCRSPSSSSARAR
jgi:regulator of sigma E protease